MIKQTNIQISSNVYTDNKADFVKSHQPSPLMKIVSTKHKNSGSSEYNSSCNGCLSQRGRLLDSIKIEANTTLKGKGGRGFLKHELQASDVRLNCKEGITLISKTKKYLSGDYKLALLNNDKRTDFILEDQQNMQEAEQIADQCNRSHSQLIKEQHKRRSKHLNGVQKDEIVLLPKSYYRDPQYIQNQVTGEKLSLKRHLRILEGQEAEFLEHLEKIKVDLIDKLQYKVFK